MIEGWTKDLAHAARALRRAPGFTVVTVVTLGLAIGVNTGVFSVVDAVLLNPLPYPEADRGSVPSFVEKEKRRNLLLTKQIAPRGEGGIRREEGYHD